MLLAAAHKAARSFVSEVFPVMEPLAAFARLAAFLRGKIAAWFVSHWTGFCFEVPIGKLGRRLHVAIQLLEFEGHC